MASAQPRFFLTALPAFTDVGCGQMVVTANFVAKFYVTRDGLVFASRLISQRSFPSHHDH